ncbi:MAG: hypothetical protein V9H26_23470 [Verrucomicrobiota bacterium]
MKTLEATPGDDGGLRCYSCGRGLRDGKWFARIQHGGGWIVFCRPWCVEVFLDGSERRTTDQPTDQ